MVPLVLVQRKDVKISKMFQDFQKISEKYPHLCHESSARLQVLQLRVDVLAVELEGVVSRVERGEGGAVPAAEADVHRRDACAQFESHSFI